MSEDLIELHQTFLILFILWKQIATLYIIYYLLNKPHPNECFR